MKLIFAVLDVSLMMGLTRCYKTEGFFTFISHITAINLLHGYCIADVFRNRNAIFSSWIPVRLCHSPDTRSATEARVAKATKETVNPLHEIFNIGVQFCCLC